MVSIYGTFLAMAIPGAISSMLWIELAGSETLLARTKSIERPAWGPTSLFKPFSCTALKLGLKTSNKLRIGSARPKSVVGDGTRTTSCRFHAGSRRHLTPLQSLKYPHDRLVNGQPMRHVWQSTDTFSHQIGMLSVQGTHRVKTI
jgi:hypothetical protein